MEFYGSTAGKILTEKSILNYIGFRIKILKLDGDWG
jgi:hypothetical protein